MDASWYFVYVFSLCAVVLFAIFENVLCLVRNPYNFVVVLASPALEFNLNLVWQGAYYLAMDFTENTTIVGK